MADDRQTAIDVREAVKRYGDFTALQKISLEIFDNEFFTLLGPSGCGKTTLLNIAAGLIAPSSGETIIAGNRVDGPGQGQGVVFQQHALFPWLTAAGNIEFGCRNSNLSRAQKRDLVKQLLDLVGLSRAADSYPRELSGGMQQRIAIARALAMDPEILVMDEPFGALDEIVRDRLNEQLLSLWARTSKTIAFVTHSIPEAVYLSTKIVVMSPRPGRITDVIDSPLPKDRPLHIRESAAFLEIAARVRDGLRAGMDADA